MIKYPFEDGWYPYILYQTHEQIPLGLYIRRGKAFKDPMYLISNRLLGHQIHHCYKRWIQIEHGFRDIKSCFGFGQLVLKKPTQARLDVLWLAACLAYGLLFISYEKVASTHWQKAYNCNNRKTFSVITIMKRLITDLWNPHFLLDFFTQIHSRGTHLPRPLQTDLLTYKPDRINYNTTPKKWGK